MAYSTADCKTLLQNDPRSAALGANPHGWQRLSKRSAPGGDHLRVFHDGGAVWALVKEDTQGLSLEGYANTAERMQRFESVVMARPVLTASRSHPDASGSSPTDVQAPLRVAMSAPTARATRPDEPGPRRAGPGRLAPANVTPGRLAHAIATTPAMEAAQLFRDFWDSVAGQPATHSGALGMMGHTWEQLARGYERQAPALDERLQPLMQRAVSTPASLKLLMDGLKWCFQSDVEYLAAHHLSMWDAGTTPILVQPIGWAAGMDVAYLTLPFHHLERQGFHAVSEGLFEHRQRDEASLIDARTAMIGTFRAMQGLGATFDLSMQEAFGEEADYDGQNPLHRKVPTLVPDAFPNVLNVSSPARRPGQR